MTDNSTEALRAVPRAGDWVLFRSDRSYDPISVEMKQAAKVTPSLVKFDGGYPRQCHILSVVWTFADKAEAERVRDAIGGIAGEYQRRRRAADEERSARVTQALAAANRHIERIIASAVPNGDAPNPSAPSNHPDIES